MIEVKISKKSQCKNPLAKVYTLSKGYVLEPAFNQDGSLSEISIARNGEPLTKEMLQSTFKKLDEPKPPFVFVDFEK